MMKNPHVVALTALLLCGPVFTQEAAEAQFAKEEADFNKQATRTLMQFASFARGKKVQTREKEAYDLVIASYDENNARARKALGFRKVKGEWQEGPPDKRPVWLDKANNKQRYQVVQKWYDTRKKLGKLHRERGLALFHDETGANVARGGLHLRQAILYDPFDREAHLALGHEEQGGYFGTPDQLAFIQRMKETETTALMLAKKDYEVEPIDAIPEALAKTGYSFHGARSRHFTIFTRGSQQDADDCAMWAERALEFFEYVAGKKAARRAKNTMNAWGWIGFVWTQTEMKKFEEMNPKLARGEEAQGMGNVIWRQGQKTVQVATKLTPAAMHDFLIAHVFRYGLYGLNDALIEGVVHASTWFLKSTCMTRFGTTPKGTASSPQIALPEGANWWLRKMRDDATAGTDMPINGVPRTPFWKFHNDARLKSWSFMTWAMARYPDDWVKFIVAVPSDKIPFPKEVDEAGEKVFGKPLVEVEAEWREWASGRGITAAATGYGPPLLPEQPNDEELDGLTRLNKLRELAKSVPFIGEKGTTEGFKSLPPCDLDAEASMACQKHAEFVGEHPEHHKWPEAHEEDPAKEGFTPQGMRAGLRSVIIFSTGGTLEAEHSIDQWIGTVYHRFPLLQYNINRIGFAYAEGSEADVIVLDMGSMEEPRTPQAEQAYRWIPWPADGMKNVPRVFAFTEHPNPLADVGLDFDDQKDTGYPVSLQMSRLVATQITEATIELYEAKKRGRKLEKGDKVPCWVHTPFEPLNKRMEDRSVLFVIPKEHLKANTTYLAVATVKPIAPRPIEWSFTTGSQGQGLGKR